MVIEAFGEVGERLTECDLTPERVTGQFPVDRPPVAAQSLLQCGRQRGEVSNVTFEDGVPRHRVRVVARWIVAFPSERIRL